MRDKFKSLLNYSFYLLTFFAFVFSFFIIIYFSQNLSSKNSNCKNTFSQTSLSLKLNSQDLTIQDSQENFVVGEKQSPVIDFSKVKTSYEYTGEPLTLDTSGIVWIEGYEGQIITTDILFTDVGNYIVQLVIPESENYLGLTKEIEVEVYAKSIDVSKYSWNYVSPFNYNGEYQTIKLKDYDSVLEPIYSGNTYKDAGSYVATVSFNLKDTQNYKIVGQTTPIVWQISKRKVNIPTVLNNLTSFTYDGEIQSLTFKDFDYNQTDYILKNNEQINAGNYVSTIELRDNKNTTWFDGSVEKLEFAWKIEKQKIAVPQVETVLVYNGKTQTLQIEESPLYIIVSNEALEIGEHSAVLILNDPLNYEWENGGVGSAYELKWSITQLEEYEPVPVMSIVILLSFVVVVALILTLQLTTIRKKRVSLTVKSKTNAFKPKVIEQNSKDDKLILESLIKEYGSFEIKDEDYDREFLLQNLSQRNLSQQTLKDIKDENLDKEFVGKIYIEDVDINETQSVKTKKRGRPRKIVNESIVVLPKKRGRPKKEKSSEEINKVPGRRGRPRKVVDLNVISNVPKKRGRPKKNVSETEIIVKIPSKRGRPKKIVEENKIEKVPAKRGRPKKNIEKQNIETEGIVTQPKKRGRPKKVEVKEDVNISEKSDSPKLNNTNKNNIKKGTPKRLGKNLDKVSNEVNTFVKVDAPRKIINKEKVKKTLKKSNEKK